MEKRAIAKLAAVLLLAACSAGVSENAAEPAPPFERRFPQPVPQTIDRVAPWRGRRHGDDESPDRPPLAIDRQTVREMETASQSLAKRDYTEAVRQLQHVLDAPADSWIETATPAGTRFVSARQQAVDRIGRLPAAVREAYEAEHGQIAQRMLNDATARGDRAGLEELVRRYFHTKAGYRAAYTLGSRLLDASMPLAAAAHLERLRESPGAGPFEPMLTLKTAYCWLRGGVPERSRAALSQLRERTTGQSVKIAGRSVPLYAGQEDPLQWLVDVLGSPAPAPVPPPSDWLLSGGTAGRNAQSVDALPIGNPAWTESAIRESNLGTRDRFGEIEKTLREYETELKDRGSLVVPGPAPVVAGNVAAFRTFGQIRAVDLHTGELLWQLAELDRHYKTLAEEKRPTRTGHRLPVSMESEEQDELRLFLNSRCFRDMTYGGLSSDGKRLFAILEAGFLGLGDAKMIAQAESLGVRTDNVLAGIDLASGALKWNIGGSREHNPPHAGTFFLGCGLPLAGTLYALGELDGEIALYNIDPATGKTNWTQNLSQPLGRLPHFPLRRLAGANPSYGAGVLVCPTTGGVIIGYDPFGRTLLWEYRYRIYLAEGLPDPRTVWVELPLDTRNDEAARWLDGSPIVAGNSVIVTPRDSDELHCLNLVDGSLRWKLDRGSGLFVAGVDEHAVFVVTRNGMQAYRLDDGRSFWERPVNLPLPGGRGFRSGSLYHLPLVSGELATIDLRHGRVLARSKLSPEAAAGNLVSASGTALLQSADSVYAFRPTSTLERDIDGTLKSHPDDAKALAMRGELRLHRGRTDAGLADLLHSVRLHSSPRVQTLAVATILENLRADFGKNRAAAEQIEPLLADPTQRSEFRRLLAKGFEEQGNSEGALDQYLRLAEDRSLAAVLIPSGESLQVQTAQLLAPALREVFSKAGGGRAQLEKKLDAWLDRVLAHHTAQELEGVLAAVRELPEADRIRRALIDRAPPAERVRTIRLAAECRALKGKSAGLATAVLARLLIASGRPADALPYLAELEGTYRAADCGGGKTGVELAKKLRADPKVKAAMSPLPPWPQTELKIKQHDEDHPAQAVQALPVDSHEGTFFQDWRFELRHASERGYGLAGIDETGAERWQLEFNAENLDTAALADHPNAIRVAGPLLQLLMRQRFVVLDATDRNTAPKILWKRDLFDPKWPASVQSRNDAGLYGVFRENFVCYQLGAAACCADSATGRVLWERRALPPRYTLHGDENYIVVLNRDDPSDPGGTVLRSSTGEEVFEGLFNVTAPFSTQWEGRYVLLTSMRPPRLSLALYDPSERRVVWTRRFETPAWQLQMDDQEFAVFDRQSKLHVFSLRSGRPIAEVQLERSGNGPQLTVKRIGDRYVAINQNLGLRGLSSPRDRGPSGKITVVDRATSKVAWSVDMPLQQTFIDSPPGSPVFVILRRQGRYHPGRSEGGESVLAVVDARNGRTVFEGAVSAANDRIGVKLLSSEHKVVITTDKARFEVTPSAAPLRAAVHADEKTDR